MNFSLQPTANPIGTPNNPARSCFVISPIGPEESTIRIEANEFLELLVEPALEKYGFLVTRADRISHPSAITTDIVRLVQESDLCLIDLTNNNPNVFYECGRRHETGRPFIQLVRKGNESNLPFDVAGIRTVVYDVSSARAARESILRLQEFIDGIVAAGFKSTTSGDSLGSIAQGVERVERKLNQVLTHLNTKSTSSSSSASVGDVEDALEIQMANPRRAFMSLLRKGRLDEAFGLLDRVKKIAQLPEYIAAVVFPVSMGHKASFERMDRDLSTILIQHDIGNDENQSIQLIAEGAKKYSENTGTLAEGLKYLIESIYDPVSASPKFTSETKAFVANKVGMLAWLADDHEVCERYTKVAIAFKEDPSYLYNLALVYKKMEDETELDKTLKRMQQLPDLDDDHKALLRKHGYDAG